MPGRSSCLALAVVSIALAACSARPSLVPAANDPRPWDRPVIAAVAVTDWTDDGQPGPPFGPGGPAWDSPQAILESMAASFAQRDVGTTAALAVETDDGTVVGWIRLEVAEGAILAADLRLDMRNDGGPWFVARTQTRVYCAEPLVDGACR